MFYVCIENSFLCSIGYPVSGNLINVSGNKNDYSGNGIIDSGNRFVGSSNMAWSLAA